MKNNVNVNLKRLNIAKYVELYSNDEFVVSIGRTISSDEEAKKCFNRLKFTEGVINGRNAVIEPE